MVPSSTTPLLPLMPPSSFQCRMELQMPAKHRAYNSLGCNLPWTMPISISIGLTPRRIQSCARNIKSNFPRIPSTLLTWLATPITSLLSLAPPTCVHYQSTRSSVISLGRLIRTLLSPSSSHASTLPPAGLTAG